MLSMTAGEGAITATLTAPVAAAGLATQVIRRLPADRLMVTEGNDAGTANDLSRLRVSTDPTYWRADQ